MAKKKAATPAPKKPSVRQKRKAKAKSLQAKIQKLRSALTKATSQLGEVLSGE